jgi:hypothetical protein
MHRVAPGILAVSVTVAALTTVSCTNSRQSPLASFTRPTPADPNAIGRISIAGNVIFNGVGETSQFTATAIFNDGTSRDVTASGEWQSSDTHVATVSEGGEARIVGFGSCVISFEYERQRASVNIRASSPDTFALGGRVREPGVGGLNGVVVVETSTGRSAVTSANGQFAITDLPRRQLHLKVEKDGYETLEVETTEQEVDLPMQRLVRLTAGETVKPADLAPNDVQYRIGTDVCTCRLIRVVVPRAGTVGVHVSWPTAGVTMRLFAEGVTASGENELSADVPVTTAREVMVYVGTVMPRRNEYVAFTFETTFR